MLVFFAILFSYISPVDQLLGRLAGGPPVDADLASLQREHNQLEAKAASLKTRTPRSRRREGSGMVQDGERSFVVKHLPHCRTRLARSRAPHA